MKQEYNDVLWCCKDALVYKSCSQDVRKHVCLVLIIMISIPFLSGNEIMSKMTSPTTHEAYRYLSK